MQIEVIAGALAMPDLPGLIDAVDVRVRAALAGDEPTLAESSLRVAGAGGKRLRPVFTMSVGHVGPAFDSERAVAGAAAIELVQVGSLVHDDLFEQASTRRQVPTINAVEGDSIALLAGDFILARAAEQATLVDQRFAALLAQTVVTLCVGQLTEMQDQHNVDRSIDAYLASIRGKTGVLFAAACMAGAHCSDMGDEAAQRVARFGEQFGMAFQLVDDVLDIVADPDRLMKPVGIDLETGVYTLPVLLAIRDGNEQLRHLLGRRTDDDLVAARQLVAHAGTIADTLAEANRYADAAADVLADIDDPTARRLASFPRSYLAWALEHFAPGLSRFGNAS